MIFENYEEYNELINEVSSAIRAGSDKNLGDEPDPVDDESVGGEVPLDEVLPPSKGHETGAGVPNTTKKQTYYGGPWIEGCLEERLCKLLEDLTTGGNDQTSNTQQATKQGQVGIVPTIGHGSAGTSPGNARRKEVDSMTKVKTADTEARVDKKKPGTEEDKSEEMNDAMKSLGLDADEAAAATPI
jgi:hypothetical protein